MKGMGAKSKETVGEGGEVRAKVGPNASMNSSMIDPATAAAAKAAGVAVEEARSLIGKFLGPACDELGAALADHVRLFRLKKQVRILRKAYEILETEGLTPKAVSLKTFVPLLEAGALEEDDDMTDRWAALLASAANPEHSADVESSFVEVLKQLSPLDARVLDTIYEHVAEQPIPPEQWHQRGVLTNGLQQVLQVDSDRLRLTIDNLVRLRLLAFPSVALQFIDNKDARFQLSNADLLCPTHLGHAFVSACRSKGTAPKALNAQSASEKPIQHTIDTTARWL